MTDVMNEQDFGRRTCRCGTEVREVGLIMPFNLDGTVHSECYMKSHRIVRVS